MKIKFSFGIVSVAALFTVLSAFAGAAPIEFVGKITGSTRYPDMIGRECTLKATPVDETPSADFHQYNVELAIKGLNPLFHKRKAPLKQMFLYTHTGSVYLAGGGKYRGEASQDLRVTFDASETKVTKWEYRDGTEDLDWTYVCE